MKKTLTIKEMACVTNLTKHTLRYYERIGLLKPVARGRSGNRQYSSQDQTWIEFLVRLRATGMPIREMQRFAELRHQGNQTADERRAMLQIHLKVIRKQIVELHECEKVLIGKIKHYKGIEKSYRK
jgi:DNA-binding transcriptional MerR regulator